MRWIKTRQVGKAKSFESELNKKGKMVEYQMIVDKRNAVKKCEKGDVEKKYQLFKSALVGCVDKCDMRRVGGGVTKGS